MPTQVLLTGVCFSDERHGVAVGHDEVILTTADAGVNWKRVHDSPEAQQPLLDVWCGAKGRAIAVGAYGTYYVRRDGGAQWEGRKLEPVKVTAGAVEVSSGNDGARVVPPTSGAANSGVVAASGNGVSAAKASTARNGATFSSAEAAAVNGDSEPGADSSFDDGLGSDFHLNAIAAASATRLYIAAEAGHLYRSDDAGETWVELPSPYEGSFFAVLAMSADGVLVGGLRGHAYKSDDAGNTWTRVETSTTATLTSIAVVAPGSTLAMVGLAGALLASRDGGNTFTMRYEPDRKGFSAALGSGPYEIVAVGEAGVEQISLAGRLP